MEKYVWISYGYIFSLKGFKKRKGIENTLVFRMSYDRYSTVNITIHEGFLFFTTISTHIKNMEIYHIKRSTKMIFWDYNKISFL